MDGWKFLLSIIQGLSAGYLLLVRAFLQAESQWNTDRLTTNIENSIERHFMGFRAEKSRKGGNVEIIS